MSGRESCDLLIVNGLILTLDPDNEVVRHGAIAVRDTRIVGLGDSAELSARYDAATTIDGKYFLVIPGLVNTHSHTPLSITRGMIEDLSFAPIYTKSVPQGQLLSAEETLALARLGMYELLRAGCTTVVDFYRNPSMLARAADEIGLRAVIVGRIHDIDLDALTERRMIHRPEIGDATLKENVDLIEAWNGRADGRIRCDFGAHGTDTCTPDLLRRVDKAASDHAGNVHIHLAHARSEVDYVKARDGMSPVELLDDIGLLNERLIAAHCVLVDEHDTARLGHAGVTVAHAPHQNAPAGNSAPIRNLAAAGARITLCTDTRSGDLFEAMRLACGSWRMKHQGYEPKARTLLEWATANGAAALGMGSTIARIAEGYKADLVLLDRRNPNLAPIVDGYGILAYSASATDVDTVIVDGVIRIRDRRPVGFDGDAIVADAQAVSERLWSRHGGVHSVTMDA